MNITLQLWISSFEASLFALPIAAAGAFLLCPDAQISKHTEGYCYLRCLLFSVFPVWNHTSRSFTCTWPWNTASIFFSLTLPLQRFLGAHVKRLSADNYLRHLGGPSVPQRTSTFTLCGRGPSIPDTPAFVVVMAAAKKDGVMLFVVVTAHSFFFLIFVLILPDPLLKNTWSLRSGCCDQRVCARLFDRVGHDQMSRGWVLVLLFYFLLALHQQRQTDFMSNVSHEGKIKCLGVTAARDLRWGGVSSNKRLKSSVCIHPSTATSAASLRC